METGTGMGCRQQKACLQRPPSLVGSGYTVPAGHTVPRAQGRWATLQSMSFLEGKSSPRAQELPEVSASASSHCGPKLSPAGWCRGTHAGLQLRTCVPCPQDTDTSEGGMWGPGPWAWGGWVCFWNEQWSQGLGGPRGPSGGPRRAGRKPGKTGHLPPVMDFPPPASQAPHAGGMGLFGTFQVSQAVPGVPGPGEMGQRTENSPAGGL